jgi:hypothetical protein
VSRTAGALLLEREGVDSPVLSESDARGSILSATAGVAALIFLLLILEFSLVRLTSSLSLSVCGTLKEARATQRRQLSAHAAHGRCSPQQRTAERNLRCHTTSARIPPKARPAASLQATTICVAAYLLGEHLSATNILGFLVCAAGILGYLGAKSTSEAAPSASTHTIAAQHRVPSTGAIARDAQVADGGAAAADGRGERGAMTRAVGLSAEAGSPSMQWRSLNVPASPSLLGGASQRSQSNDHDHGLGLRAKAGFDRRGSDSAPRRLL